MHFEIFIACLVSTCSTRRVPLKCVYLQMMEQLTDHHYEVLTVPEEAAANCVYIKGANATNFLLHPHPEECPDSVSVRTTVWDQRLNEYGHPVFNIFKTLKLRDWWEYPIFCSYALEYMFSSVDSSLS